MSQSASARNFYISKPVPVRKTPDMLSPNEIASKVAQVAKLTLFVDNRFLLKEGDHTRWVLEIRKSKHNHDRHPSYRFSHDKWKAMHQHSRNSGVPHVIVVAFADGIYMTQVVDSRYKVIPVNDEMLIHIPYQEFKKLLENS